MMYELFILGELSDGPMHGYLLHQILLNVLGPMRTVSWGTLYPVLQKLEQEGLIALAEESSGPQSGRPKKVYAITDRGREQFLRLMERPLEHNAETEDIFRIKLSKFHLMPAKLCQTILSQYKAWLDLVLDALAMTRARVEQEMHIADQERPDILQAIDYETTAYMARLEWVENALLREETRQ
ncbi:PadR family transcriptional regulator [Sulfobacillus harzensis]|uniref:PadR family transcriptional regulator n=1 Tax=Sulfobacillus harzensis TaxID=2729629 RepID=A0A7Y0L313_9FIRM|nr:PadR family transcriptional regulator [Sulfobacillus harzensis]NMP22379.1 PadR family transcriptional regulator [Sulfobacillus harzensis]